MEKKEVDGGEKSPAFAARQGRNLSLAGFPSGLAARRRQDQFLAVARALLNEGLCLEFMVTGASMRPFLCDGDLVRASPFGGIPRTGRVVMVATREHGVLIHRISGIERKPCGHPVVWVSGDGLFGHDVAVPLAAITGEIVDVVRGGRHIGTRPWRARFWRSTRGLRHWVSRFQCMVGHKIRIRRRSD